MIPLIRKIFNNHKTHVTAKNLAEKKSRWMGRIGKQQRQRRQNHRAKQTLTRRWRRMENKNENKNKAVSTIFSRWNGIKASEHLTVLQGTECFEYSVPPLLSLRLTSIRFASSSLFLLLSLFIVIAIWCCYIKPKFTAYFPLLLLVLPLRLSQPNPIQSKAKWERERERGSACIYIQ